MVTPGLLPFASIVQEMPPLQHSQWWSYLETFLQDAGAFALLGLGIWMIAVFARALTPAAGQRRAGIPLLLLVVTLAALTLYAIGGIGGLVTSQLQSRDATPAVAPPDNPLEPPAKGRWFSYLVTAGGALALLGIFVPFALDSKHLRVRRIWALARLTFLEAVRRRVLWVFLIFLLLFLFPPKWFVLIKAEDEVRTNVNLIHFGANAVLLLTAAALATFSIPTDIRNQTIHTIVTKPVEKFEIVIGRYLGFLGLTTMVMLGVFAVALVMLLASRVDPEAREESMKSRVAIYGDLGFEAPSRNFQGESVGREWEYRRYIPGHPGSPYKAVWLFTDHELRRSLANLPVVNCEFSFDIFRTSKGEENRAVECTFFAIAHQAGRNREQLAKIYQDRTKGLSPKASPFGTPAEQRDWEQVSKIAGELGYYEYRNKPIADYHTDSIPIPATLFAKAYASDPEKVDVPGKGLISAPRLMVAVRCETRSQYLGVAKTDLYLLASEGDNLADFCFNFFKGSVGLWLRLCVVIGIAVTCSTYLNGVVSLLVTGVLTFLGFAKPIILSMAAQLAADVPNPGPADSLRKLMSNESLGAAPDATNPTHQVTSAADEVFRWGMRRVLSMIPDMYRWTWQDYVANGFSVPLRDDVLWNFLGVVGYLSLWAVLGHYLMKWREIATW